MEGIFDAPVSADSIQQLRRVRRERREIITRFFGGLSGALVGAASVDVGDGAQPRPGMPFI
jgi:hypothetical protein